MRPIDEAEAWDVITWLVQQPRETEWFEFKLNQADPNRIARYAAALANMAALNSREFGYLVWGIDDASHQLVGTDFSPSSTTHKGSELGFWLAQELVECDFAFIDVFREGKRFVLMVVAAAVGRPVVVEGKTWGRVESSLVELRRFKHRETELWAKLRNTTFEEQIAAENVDEQTLVNILSLDLIYSMRNRQVPMSLEQRLEDARALGVLSPRDGGGWNVTNLGAMLFSSSFSHFPHLAEKAVRVVRYEGSDRARVVRRQDGEKGYAVGFRGLLRWISLALPAREVYIDGVRENQTMFPELLMRESIANALIHQDLAIRGAGPRIELFSDRVEITNPGEPLVAPDRMLNSAPVARNPGLAGTMRHMGLCESFGTGWDRMAAEAEYAALPAPRIEAQSASTRVTLLGPRKMTSMPKDERLWAVYLHACLQWSIDQRATNSSLRARFGIVSKNSSQVSRLIKDAIQEGHIKQFDPAVGAKSRSYVPYWA